MCEVTNDVLIYDMGTGKRTRQNFRHDAPLRFTSLINGEGQTSGHHRSNIGDNLIIVIVRVVRDVTCRVRERRKKTGRGSVH